MTDIVIALTILIVSQWLMRFFFEPILEYRKLVGEIASSLTHYSNLSRTVAGIGLGSIPDEEPESMREKIMAELRVDTAKREYERINVAVEVCRRQASDLLPSVHAIPFYRLLGWTPLLPRLQNVIQASSEMIGFSNEVGESGVNLSERRKKIAKLLKIAPLIRKFGA